MSKARSRYTLITKSSKIKKFFVEGYDSFCELVDRFHPSQKVFVYFAGSKVESGQSWCPDCNKAQRIIENGLAKADPNAYFIHVAVGDKQSWFDPTCPFRTDPRTKLICLPTLMLWQSQQVLNADQCSNPDLVEILFMDIE